MIKKIHIPIIRTQFAYPNALQSTLNPHFVNRQQPQASSSLTFTPQLAFLFSNQKPQKPPVSEKTQKPPVNEALITFFIQNAQTPQQLLKIISDHKQQFNFIHRTILLQKATQRPFDKDPDLTLTIIDQIKTHWQYDYAAPSQTNARAIANTVCYMSRKAKLHHLDQQFAVIDFDELAKLINPKEFVMMFTGLLKLQLIDKVIANSPSFNPQTFLASHVNSSFHPGLLVSMWFNIIKYNKSTPIINDFFANLLQTKHFKNNLIDYMQIIYCYVHTAKTRTVDLNYTLMTHPKQIKDEKGYLGAHELSVMYEQLGKLKMMQEVYFSQEFNQLLGKCFQKILKERDIPLRNVANVFVNLTRWQNPTSKILEAVNQKYYNVLKNQISLLQKYQQNKKFKPNVDPLSFVTLFQKLLEHYQAQNRYLNILTFISMSYVQKIIDLKIISEYNEKTFVRLLEVVLLARKMIEHKRENPNEGAKSIPLYNDQNPINEPVKQKLSKQIVRITFNEVASLNKIIMFADKMNIRDKELCTKIKKMIMIIPKENQKYETYRNSLKQSCIIRSDCPDCKRCLA